MVNRAEFIHIVPFAAPSGFLFSGSYISHISLHQRLIDSIFFPSTISPYEQFSLQILDLPAKRAACFDANCVNRARAREPSSGGGARAV